MPNTYCAIFDIKRESWELTASLPLACVVDGVPAPFATPTIENGGLFDPAIFGLPVEDPLGNPYYWPNPALSGAQAPCMVSSREVVVAAGFLVYDIVNDSYFTTSRRAFKFTFGQDNRKKEPKHKAPHYDAAMHDARRAARKLKTVPFRTIPK